MLKEVFNKPTKWSVMRGLILKEIDDLIIDSLGIVAFISFFVGGVVAIQTALNLTKPRGTLVLKSTVAASKEFNLAPIVIDEIRVQGSRCGQFAPALRLLASGKIDFNPLISGVYPVDKAMEAFEKNKEKGTLKVLIKF